MALLLDDLTSCTGAPAAKPRQRGADGPGSVLPALVARWDLDPADFQLRAHELCDSAGFARGSTFVTVTSRRVRTSRTYLSRLHPDEWISEFEQDLRAGVFSP